MLHDPVLPMRRRTALSLMASGFIAACGGGGGGDAGPVAGSAPVPPGGTDALAGGTPQPGAVETRRDVAVWGDSLTYRMADLLAPMLAARRVYNGGVIGETSTEIARRQAGPQGTSRADWVNVFWYGHNNQTESDRIVADLAASIARLAPGNHRFLVLALVNQATAQEARGGEDYEGILRTNRILQAQWPSHFLDIREFLVTQADRSRWDDDRDFLRDVPPASLRHDAIHLNDEGSARVARRVRNELASRGW